MTGTLTHRQIDMSSGLSRSSPRPLKPALSRAVPAPVPLFAKRLARGLALVASIALVSPVVEADVTVRLWEEPVTALSGCVGAINEGTSAGTRCLFGQGLSLMLNEGLRFANEVGQNKLGEHFQIVNNLTWSSSTGQCGCRVSPHARIPEQHPVRAVVAIARSHAALIPQPRHRDTGAN